MTRKIKCRIEYPWKDVEADIATIEFFIDPLFPLEREDLEKIAFNYFKEKILEKIDFYWEEVDKDAEE